MRLKLALTFLIVTFMFVITHFMFTPPRFYSFWTLVGYISTEILIGLVAAVLLSKLFTRKLSDLAAAATVISRGDLSRRVEVRGKDEVGDLACAFNTMTQSLYQIVTEARTVSGQIFESAQSLSATAEEMNATTQEISSTV